MAAPQVSVLVTTYNHALFVEEALNSLLEQTRQDFEVLITDDASTDGTPAIITRWLARTRAPYRFVLNPRNVGICANRNAAIAATSAPFLCSLSGDDAYTPDRLARQLAMFEGQPGHVGAVYGDMMFVGEDGRETGVTFLQSKFGSDHPPEDAAVFPSLFEVNWLPAPAVMVRRQALESVGPYDETLINEDYDMWLRLSHRFHFRFLPAVILRYRMLTNSLSHSAGNTPAFHRSHARSLAKWVREFGPAHPVITERLWWIGRDQLKRNEDAEGSRNLSLAAAVDGRPKRRLVARLARHGIGRTTLRASGLL